MAFAEETSQPPSKRGIPAIEFLEDVDGFMARSENNELGVEGVMKKLEETHQKYRMVEASIMRQRLRYKSKLPELQNSLKLLDRIDEKQKSAEPMETRFLLSEQCFASASIPPTQRVSLWLGANVMLEYSIEEARELLQKNVTAAEKGLSELEIETDFVKDQLTTTEVNMARVYNWGVVRDKGTAAASSVAALTAGAATS